MFLFWNDSFVKCGALIGFHFWGALRDDTKNDCKGDKLFSRLTEAYRDSIKEASKTFNSFPNGGRYIADFVKCRRRKQFKISGLQVIFLVHLQSFASKIFFD